MTEDLKLSLNAVCSMRHPSVGSLLRRNLYEYEAQQIERLVKAWEGSRHCKSAADGQDHSPRLQRAIGIITDLLNTCELNLDEIEPETEAAVASAHEFLNHMAGPA